MNIVDFLGKNDIALLEDLTSRLTSCTLKKGEYFIRCGEKMNKIGILYHGLLVSRYTSNSGKEAISKIYYPGGDWIVVDYYSFKNRCCSDESIKAEEDSLLHFLKFDDFEYLLNKYDNFREFAFGLAEESYLKALGRVRDFQLLNAGERVKKFEIKHKDIIGKLDVQDKASYLGIYRNTYTRNSKKN